MVGHATAIDDHRFGRPSKVLAYHVVGPPVPDNHGVGRHGSWPHPCFGQPGASPVVGPTMHDNHRLGRHHEVIKPVLLAAWGALVADSTVPDNHWFGRAGKLQARYAGGRACA